MFWRFTTILSLLLAMGLGYWIFSHPEPAPLAIHALFFIVLLIFFSKLLQGMRSRIEFWIAEQRDTPQTQTQESEIAQSNVHEKH